MLALRTAAVAGDSVTDVAMEKALRLSRRTIWEWRLDARFRAWLYEAIVGDSDIRFALARARHEELAIKGSTKSFAILARLRTVGIRGGGFAPEDVPATDPSVNNYSVILLCPRPLPPPVTMEGPRA